MIVFGEHDFMLLAAAVSIFARRNLNRILGYFEQRVATHSLDEYKAHFFYAEGNMSKYRPQNLILFSPVELQLCSQTSANTAGEKGHT